MMMAGGEGTWKVSNRLIIVTEDALAKWKVLTLVLASDDPVGRLGRKQEMIMMRGPKMAGLSRQVMTAPWRKERPPCEI